MLRAATVWPALGALLLLVLAAGCGGEEQAPSGPSAGDGAAARGSPDAQALPTPSVPPAELLVRLHERVAAGSGLSDATWVGQVESVGRALWPEVGGASARRTHQVLATIAGDVARSLATDPEARAAWLERDPGSVTIHDAFLEAAAAGPEAYVAWVEADGAGLLRARIEDLGGG